MGCTPELSSPPLEARSKSALDCGQRVPIAVSSDIPSASVSISNYRREQGSTYNRRGEGANQVAVPHQESHEGNMDLKMPSSECCDDLKTSGVALGNAIGTSLSASEGENDNDDRIQHAKLLQKEGRYEAWAPLLRDVLPSRGPSMLLGRISFDVTAEDERGSWLLPEEALAPQQDSVVEEDGDRQVFTNTPVSEEEQQAVDEIVLQLFDMQECDQTGDVAQKSSHRLQGVQPAWLEQLILRYLHSCSFDKQKTLELLQSTLEFRTHHLPVVESEVYSELRNVGACYWHGRDRNMRPLLVLSLQRLQQLQAAGGAEAKVSRLIVFCLEFFLRYLCVAGVVESWSILCDLSDTSIASSPFPLLLKVMRLIQGAYRGRLHRFYILYAPRLFHFVAKPLLSSLPSTTAKKIRVFTNIEDWKQERCTQFADHQLEEKFGGTAPDITENWYPFRFFPGPFDPSASQDSITGSGRAVRWESERSLHAKVHSSVHTGASLHTSLLLRRTREARGVAVDGDERKTLRYAAWLHHLPELVLAPTTAQWASELLRHRLHDHHQNLIHSLQDASVEEQAVAPIAAHGLFEAQAIRVAVYSKTTSSNGGASRSAPASVEPSTASHSTGPTSPHKDSACTVSPPSGSQQVQPPASKDALERSVRQVSSVTDQTTAAAVCDARQMASVFSSRKARVGDGAFLESPFSHSPSGPEAPNCVSPPRYNPASLGQARQPTRGTVSSDVPSWKNACRRQDDAKGWRSSRQQQPEIQGLESPVQQQLLQTRRGLSFPLSSSNGDAVSSAASKGSVSVYARAYWALERPLISPPASADLPHLPNSEPAVQSPNLSEGIGRSDIHILCLMEGGRPYRRCASEAGKGFGLHSGWRRQTRESVQQALLDSSQPVGPVPLQHPQSPSAGSVGGACRTVSISGVGLAEGALGTPAASAWHNTPACDRPPSSCAFGSQETSVLECGQPRDCQNLEGGCGAPASSIQRPNQLPSRATVAQKATFSGAGLSQPASGVQSGQCSSEGSRTSSLSAATRLLTRISPQFISPVAADPSPSESVYSAAGSTPSGSCLLCNDNLKWQSTAIGCTPASRNQVERAHSEVCEHLTTPTDERTPRGTSKLSNGGTKAVVDSQAYRDMEVGKLRRIVRALYRSVSGSQGRSDQQLISEYDYAEGASRSRRRHRRYADSQRQLEQRPFDKGQPREGKYVGLRRRLSHRLLSGSLQSPTVPTGAARAPTSALKRRYYRRLSFHGRRNGAAARSRLFLRTTSLPAISGDCQVLRELPRRAKTTAASLSMVRNTSRRLVQLRTSLSDRVRRGKHVISIRIHHRSRSTGDI